ncbi:uncharacterized protein [Diabrotica undecimpunctata]|uniref:uncharacterized protein isoform X3 n=1 Tax=Diabrotica undecimpunctata TaxID=50387 RepID=UPI003B6423BC
MLCCNNSKCISRTMFFIYAILVSWKIAESVTTGINTKEESFSLNNLKSHRRTSRQINSWFPPQDPDFGDPSSFGNGFDPDFNVGPFSINRRPGNNFAQPWNSRNNMGQPPNEPNTLKFPWNNSNGNNRRPLQGSNNDFDRPWNNPNNNRRPFDGSGNNDRQPFTNPNRRPQSSDGSGNNNNGRRPFTNPNRRPQLSDGSGNDGRQPFNNPNRRPQSFDGSDNDGRKPFTNPNRRPQSVDGSGTGGFDGNINIPRDTTTTENPLSTLPYPGAATTMSPCEQNCQATGESDPVCGNNRVTYNNIGRFQCAVDCLSGLLELAHYGICRT